MLVTAVFTAHPQAADAPRKFAITEVALHQSDGGPTLPASHLFLPGESVFVTFRVAGYQKAGEERERIHITWQLEAFDPEGVPIVESKKDKIDVELAAEDKNWVPKARHNFELPPIADSGTYRITLAAKDELSGAASKIDIPFRLRGPAVEPSATLTYRNFRWLRSEDDTTPLKTSSYRPGDQVWARFAITGYKFAAANRFEISYGLEVFRDAEGKSMYKEDTAATITDQSFYPKRHMGGVLNLNLQPDIAKGSYTILLRLRDHVAAQTHESRHTFVIE